MSDSENTAHESDADFLAESAQLFARAFVGLNQVFGSEGSVKILCEEQERTIAVGIRPAHNGEEADVDCILLEANQESLRDCLNVLFEEA